MVRIADAPVRCALGKENRPAAPDDHQAGLKGTPRNPRSLAGLQIILEKVRSFTSPGRGSSTGSDPCSSWKSCTLIMLVMACAYCKKEGHNVRTCPGELNCGVCDRPLSESEAIDHGDEWLCSECFENSNAPAYCCGIMYDHGETTCMSCGDPL